MSSADKIRDARSESARVRGGLAKRVRCLECIRNILVLLFIYLFLLRIARDEEEMA